MPIIGSAFVLVLGCNRLRVGSNLRYDTPHRTGSHRHVCNHHLIGNGPLPLEGAHCSRGCPRLGIPLVGWCEESGQPGSQPWREFR